MLFSNDYKTILEDSFGEYREKGSVFKAFAFPVESEADVKFKTLQIKEAHPKANHHCYAFILGPGQQSFRFSDDREPSGTAGRSIFNAIKSKDLTNVLIVVVRYFGGTLLGVQGLIKAYRTSAANALQSAKIITVPIMERFEVEFPYNRTGDMEHLISKSSALVVIRKMDQKCIWVIDVPKEQAENIFRMIRESHPFTLDCSIKSI